MSKNLDLFRKKTEKKLFPRFFLQFCETKNEERCWSCCLENFGSVDLCVRQKIGCAQIIVKLKRLFDIGRNFLSGHFIIAYIELPWLAVTWPKNPGAKAN